MTKRMAAIYSGMLFLTTINACVSSGQVLEQYKNEGISLMLEQAETPDAKVDLANRLLVHSKKYLPLRNDHFAPVDVRVSAGHLPLEEDKFAGKLYLDAVELSLRTNELGKAKEIYRDMIRKLTGTVGSAYIGFAQGKIDQFEKFQRR